MSDTTKVSAIDKAICNVLHRLAGVQLVQPPLFRSCKVHLFLEMELLFLELEFEHNYQILLSSKR